MTTPIFDFVRRYAGSDAVRMHMPGHKGVPVLGCEPYDLTEIDGADELFAPSGIIAESEANASKIFGCKTYYSTEGSSLCIRAMLCMAVQYAAEHGRQPVIFAARNVHKTFLTAAALLRFRVKWLPQHLTGSYLQTAVDWEKAAAEIKAEKAPCAVYLTSPDYLGNMADIRAAASFCHAHEILLLVDNAHGAYLRFLPESLHPADLGADLCCDSAHKTLPVLTGGAYLHVAGGHAQELRKYAKSALSLFATTSPSYLILASLDRCNAVLNVEYCDDLRQTIAKVQDLREILIVHGWQLTGNEPMKLTINPKSFGYTGTELASILQKQRIYVEFADPDNLVLMPSVNTPAQDLAYVRDVLCNLPRRPEIHAAPPFFPIPETILQPHEVLLSPAEELPADQCKGRICAEFSVSCPPAVPIVMAGECINGEAVSAMQYYGIKSCKVIR